MIRSKRNIRAPKRFDEEPPAATPTRVQQPEQTPQQPVIKPKLEPASVSKQSITPRSGGLIKIKLKSSKPTRETPKASKETIKPIRDTPKPFKDNSPEIDTSPNSKTASPAPISPIDIKPPLVHQKAASAPKIALPPITPKNHITSIKPQSVKTAAQVKTPVAKAQPYLKSPVVKSPGVKSPTLKTPAIKSHSFKCSRKKQPTTPPFENVIPNVTLPFWDARTAADEHEDDNVKELVHCHCGITEELGLMVQCEICLTWQHAQCLGFEQEEDAPDGYTCQACSDPKFARGSRRWAYDQDWIMKGRMKKFLCDQSTHENDIEVLKKINQLIEDSLKISHLIHSLRAKKNILANATDEDDPELKLFKTQWPANYMHSDGAPFVATPGSPASTMSAMVEADAGDLSVEAVADLKGALPDINIDVSAILGSADIPANPPGDCISNLKLHIKQTEEFISLELSHISDQLAAMESELQMELTKTKFVSLKNDLISMRRYFNQKITSSMN